MTAKEHYENHLGNFYSWMVGDFQLKQQEQEFFFKENNITPSLSGVAFDLGCGHGLQSVGLANLGYQVYSVDFNPQLLNELKFLANPKLKIVEADLLEFIESIDVNAELIACMGDTLTHLASFDDVIRLFRNVNNKLEKGGRFILSFRDMSKEPAPNSKVIPVKSDDTRIHTCFLEYHPTTVSVYDILHERENQKWIQKVSWYPKLRLSVEDVIKQLGFAGFSPVRQSTRLGMTYLIGQKKL